MWTLWLSGVLALRLPFSELETIKPGAVVAAESQSIKLPYSCYGRKRHGR